MGGVVGEKRVGFWGSRGKRMGYREGGLEQGTGSDPTGSQNEEGPKLEWTKVWKWERPTPRSEKVRPFLVPYQGTALGRNTDGPAGRYSQTGQTRETQGEALPEQAGRMKEQEVTCKDERSNGGLSGEAWNQAGSDHIRENI